MEEIEVRTYVGEDILNEDDVRSLSRGFFRLISSTIREEGENRLGGGLLVSKKDSGDTYQVQMLESVPSQEGKQPADIVESVGFAAFMIGSCFAEYVLITNEVHAATVDELVPNWAVDLINSGRMDPSNYVDTKNIQNFAIGILFNCEGPIWIGTLDRKHQNKVADACISWAATGLKRGKGFVSFLNSTQGESIDNLFNEVDIPSTFMDETFRDLVQEAAEWNAERKTGSKEWQ